MLLNENLILVYSFLTAFIGTGFRGNCHLFFKNNLFSSSTSLNYGCVYLQHVIDNQVLQLLYQLLTANHKKSIKKETCWTISNITAGNKAQIQVKNLVFL